MRFGILGPLVVWTSSGQSVTVPHVKVRSLLAVLLLNEGRLVSVDRLADEVWGQTQPGSPTRALHTKVWQLRRALDTSEAGAGALVVSRPPGYQLTLPPGALDSERFRELVSRARQETDLRARAAALAEALGLWRGEPLADFADAEFARAAISRLNDERLTAMEDRAEVMLELGEHSLLVSELGDLVAREPLRERLRAAHMRALYGAGRLRDALGSYDDLRKRMATELGMDPGSEVSALYQAMLEQRPEVTASPAPITTATRPLSNLPAELSTLVGRDEAVGHVRALLDAGRLVTLSGIGGVGKTRLALAVAHRSAPSAPDGVWLAELGKLEAAPDDPPSVLFDAVVYTIAEVVGVRDETSATLGGNRVVSMVERLVEALRAKQMLIVLDNCEHLVATAATLVERLLKAAPGLRVLATSREPLGIAGERLWTVPPLELPDPAAVDPAQLARAGAVRLFVTRATATVPGFRLDVDNAEAVRSICLRLDGIPFALELAATRVRALGVHEVSARLSDRFSLLTVGLRDAPARQQTLRAAIDWSWQLLGDEERAVLRRMSVHIGGCGLAAAETICSGRGVAAPDVLDVVARLVDRSLIAFTDGPDGPRYRLLESVAAYCAERLSEAGETEWSHRAHLDYHVEFAERALPHLRLRDQRGWLARLDTESPNLRAALDFAARSGAADQALRLVTTLAWYWFLRGRLSEGLRAITAALAIRGDSAADLRTVATAWRCGFALRVGETELSSTERVDAANSALDTVADTRQRAMARWFLAFAQSGYGEREVTVDRARQALAEFRELDEPWGVAAALGTMAVLSALRGDLDGVRAHGTESADLFAALGDGWGRLQAGDALALHAETRGDYDEAVLLHREGLRVAESLGLWTEVSLKLAGLGRIALLRGEFDQATELHERASRLAAEQGFTFGEQFADVGLGLGHRRRGDYELAERYLLRWLDWCRQVDGEVGSALILAELGFIAELRGDPAGAVDLHRQSFAAAATGGDPRALALALEGMACACAADGRPELAAVLLGSAAQARDLVDAALPEAERADVDRATAAAVAKLGADAFAAAIARGRGLSPEQAHALLDGDPVSAR
ncbi:BTAD domain-containing putative transcriptional regulator [Actinokineospora pegani]|uniref:BTAD domain-containing putative transcriptional regulator n=1 Tax=Actinokineospora pegani TaxID=2654637 RepID=UPI0012E9AF77|nr:BTAD domain-containing putative transcriptional regulator [Actinokineospora pegani]